MLAFQVSASQCIDKTKLSLLLTALRESTTWQSFGVSWKEEGKVGVY